jgi:hypothetical protein
MLRRLALTAAAIGVAACADSNGPEDLLTVDLQISADHVHALETEVTYTVLVTDASGNVVSDFEGLAVEYGLEGSNDWGRVALDLQSGGSYQGTHQYPGPGEFALRVVGTRPGGSETVLHEVTEPVEVIRPHFDAGGYRVEFELDPADLRPGINLTLQFYVMQAQRDASGNRPPITGLAGVTISCIETNGATSSHNAVEGPGGVYQASHTFLAPGTVTARIQFTGNVGQPAEVNVPLTLH